MVLALTSSSSSRQFRDLPNVGEKKWSRVVGGPECRELTDLMDLKNGVYFRGAFKRVIWSERTSDRVIWNGDYPSTYYCLHSRFNFAVL